MESHCSENIHLKKLRPKIKWINFWNNMFLAHLSLDTHFKFRFFSPYSSCMTFFKKIFKCNCPYKFVLNVQIWYNRRPLQYVLLYSRLGHFGGLETCTHNPLLEQLQESPLFYSKKWHLPIYFFTFASGNHYKPALFFNPCCLCL